MAITIEMTFPVEGISGGITIPLVFPVFGRAHVGKQVVIEPDVLCQFIVGVSRIIHDYSCKLSSIMDKVGIRLRSFAIEGRKRLAVPLTVVMYDVEQHLFRQGSCCIADGQHHIARLGRGGRTSCHCQHLLTCRQTVGSCVTIVALAGHREGIVHMVGILATRETGWYGGQPSIIG